MEQIKKSHWVILPFVFQGEGTGQKTINNQNEELVKLLRRMDDEKYYGFLSVLYERQRDLVNALTGMYTGILCAFRLHANAC